MQLAPYPSGKSPRDESEGGALPIILPPNSISISGEEFFFLDKDTRLCKVAPEGWREQHPKGSMDTLTLFLRIKFFVSHYGLLR